MTEHLPFTLNSKLLPWLFFLLILLLPTQFGKHFWPNFSFIYGQRIDYYAPTLYVTDILSFIFISFVFFKHRLAISRSSVLFSACLFLCISIGIFYSRNAFEGWYQLAKLAEYLLLGFAIKTYLDALHTLKPLILPLTLGVISESILSIWQFLQQSSIGGVFYYFGERTFNGDTPGIANTSLYGQLILRPYGTFSHPNVLAAYLVLSLIIILFFGSKMVFPLWMKILMNISLILGTLATVFSLSRVSIVVWLGTVTILALKFFRRKLSVPSPFPFLWFLSHVLFLAVVLSVFLITPLSERFFSLTLDNQSVTDRFALGYIALVMFLNHPLLGVGLGNFIGELPYQVYHHRVDLLLQPVHNIILLSAAETGILGFCFFLFFLAKSIQHIAKREKWIVCFLLGIILFSGQFDHYFFTLQQGQLLFTLILSLCWTTF